MLARISRWLRRCWPGARSYDRRPEPVTLPVVYPDDSAMLEDTAYPYTSMLPIEQDPRSHA